MSSTSELGPLSMRVANQRREYFMVTGRPLVEEQFSHPTVTNTLEGSRRGHPTNMDAMLEHNRHRKSFLDGFAWINQHYFKNRQTDQVRINDLHQLSNIAIWLPTYLKHRAQNTVDTSPIPTSVGLVSKGAEGIRRVTEHLILNERGNEIMSPEEFYQFSEDNGFLIGADESCPAASSIIIRSTAALMHGTSGDPLQSDLGTLVSPEEFETVSKFAQLINFYRLLNTRFTINHYGEILKFLSEEGALQEVPEHIPRGMKLPPDQENNMFNQVLIRLLGGDIDIIA
jgi:hypothetical protein